MSSFECRNGHDMAPSKGPFCEICGERVAYMDGKSNRQLRMEEAEYDRREPEPEEEKEGYDIDGQIIDD